MKTGKKVLLRIVVTLMYLTIIMSPLAMIIDTLLEIESRLTEKE